MAQLTFKQSVFLAVEIRSKFLDNVEAEARPSGIGQRHAAYLLDRIIGSSETLLEFDHVQRDLGYVMAIIVERHTATAAELDNLVRAAKDYDMTATGSMTYDLSGAAAKPVEPADPVEPTPQPKAAAKSQPQARRS